jgi:hypothetical protein
MLTAAACTQVKAIPESLRVLAIAFVAQQPGGFPQQATRDSDEQLLKVVILSASLIRRPVRFLQHDMRGQKLIHRSLFHSPDFMREFSEIDIEVYVRTDLILELSEKSQWRGLKF